MKNTNDIVDAGEEQQIKKAKVHDASKYTVRPSAILGVLKKGGDSALIDESLVAIRQNGMNRLRRLFAIEDSVEIEKPVVFFGPSRETILESPFLSKVFKDGILRYSNYSISIFLFGEKSLYRYNAEVSAMNHRIAGESIEEIFYKDVISAGIYTELAETSIKTPPQQLVTTLEIGTAARTHISTLRNRSVEETHKKFVFDEKKMFDSFLRLKRVIETRKSEVRAF